MNKTTTCITAGLIISLIILIPDWSYQNQLGWKLEDTPLSHLTQGLIYFEAFLHETAHSISNWFYGYPYKPVFDMAHSGGSVHTISKNTYLTYLFYPLIAGAIFYWRRNKKELIAFLCISIFHELTAHTNTHHIVMIVSGYVFTTFLGYFFLNRAWSNTAPRGLIERYLNSIIGFSVVMHNMLLFWGIYHGNITKVIYNPDKASVKLNDFNQLHTAVPQYSIQEMGYYGVLICLTALIIPILLHIAVKLGLISAIKSKFM